MSVQVTTSAISSRPGLPTQDPKIEEQNVHRGRRLTDNVITSGFDQRISFNSMPLSQSGEPSPHNRVVKSPSARLNLSFSFPQIRSKNTRKRTGYFPTNSQSKDQT
jgi:hypothetical protein